MTTPKIGLALGSGSARGWAHIGVIRVLEEAGLAPDILVQPRLSQMAFMDFHRAESTIGEGRRAASQVLPQLQQLGLGGREPTR